ncbi:Protein cordon-bleu [Pteropus alecto]|uniref:Protein cordon-bleu n=1 Tax=Pteropus alecto TaxID=9402 RepID=L5KMZ4_PTEAL|nr:Protein cordon-bleu [Pteropus alecto]
MVTGRRSSGLAVGASGAAPRVPRRGPLPGRRLTCSLQPAPGSGLSSLAEDNVTAGRPRSGRRRIGIQGWLARDTAPQIGVTSGPCRSPAGCVPPASGATPSRRGLDTYPDSQQRLRWRSGAGPCDLNLRAPPHYVEKKCVLNRPTCSMKTTEEGQDAGVCSAIWAAADGGAVSSSAHVEPAGGVGCVKGHLRAASQAVWTALRPLSQVWQLISRPRSDRLGRVSLRVVLLLRRWSSPEPHRRSREGSREKRAIVGALSAWETLPSSLPLGPGSPCSIDDAPEAEETVSVGSCFASEDTTEDSGVMMSPSDTVSLDSQHDSMKSRGRWATDQEGCSDQDLAGTPELGPRRSPSWETDSSGHGPGR